MTRAGAKHSAWYTTSRLAQTAWKLSTPTLPDAARQPGMTMVEERGARVEIGPFPICLPLPFAHMNLLSSVRDDAIGRFARHGIDWHAWSPGPSDATWPSGHLLDSQVQCVNVLLSLAREPALLFDLVRQVEANATDVVSVEDDSPVVFEWIGREDYLGEGRGHPRDRGRFCTSADALVVVQRPDGRTGILVEWKFTETYDRAVPFRGYGGTDRRDVYRAAYDGARCPLSVRPPIEAFFHEPHYQLLRQALLADAMVEAGEHGIDRAILLHVVPGANHALRAITTPGLTTLGENMETIWLRLLPGPRVTYRCLDSAPMLVSTPELRERYGMLVG